MKGLPKQELQLRVVGITFRPGYPDNLLRLQRMTQQVTTRIPVQLRQEPDNPHDPNAVAVLVDGVHLGYLSREMAKRATYDLNHNVERRAWIAKVEIHPEHLDQPGLWIALDDAATL